MNAHVFEVPQFVIMRLVTTPLVSPGLTFQNSNILHLSFAHQFESSAVVNEQSTVDQFRGLNFVTGQPLEKTAESISVAPYEVRVEFYVFVFLYSQPRVEIMEVIFIVMDFPP